MVPPPQPVPLKGWRLASAIEFQFPSDSVIPAGGYLVVAANPAESPWCRSITSKPAASWAPTQADWETVELSW